MHEYIEGIMNFICVYLFGIRSIHICSTVCMCSNFVGHIFRECPSSGDFSDFSAKP